MSRRFGLEAEYLLENARIHTVLEAGIPGITSEFFTFMVEAVTDPYLSATCAVHELRERIEMLERQGFELGRYASFQKPRPSVTFADVAKDTPYYRWVFNEACHNPQDLHFVGIHINISDTELSGDALIHAVNWLRAMNFLFIFLTANSPLMGGKPSGFLSRRAVFFPNRYDVPLWGSERAFRHWIAGEERAHRIYPGKGRCWMPIAPRFPDNDLTRGVERIEVRSLDSGRNLPWEIVEGCCELAERVIDHSRRTKVLPVPRADFERHDKSTGRFGREAYVMLCGKRHTVEDVARHWCCGIPALEDVLRFGSPAERVLNAL